MRVPDHPLHGELTVVRAATEEDAALLVSWHADPDVARYWDGETFTVEEMRVRLARPDVDPYVIEERGEPVGYIQAWFEDEPQIDAGLDMFLILSARGRGLGPDAAATLAGWLLDQGEQDRLTVDPYLWNVTAIIAWEKAGFRAVREGEPDEQRTAPWLLMEMEAPSTHRAFWESQASNWIAWARTPDHDAYWDYSPAFFREIVPQPGERTLEIGCGEGRVSRDLERLGHTVTAIDGSPTLVAAAAEADPQGSYLLADAAALPFPDSSFDVVVACNSLMDMDDMPGVVKEAARIMASQARLCICVTHPMSDVGGFREREPEAPFVIEGGYLTSGLFDQTFERAGMVMRFRGQTHPLEAYTKALERAGLLIERITEPAQTDEAVEADAAERRWQRLPMFLFLRALKPPG